MSDPGDELADVDVISSGGEDFGAFAASRWPELVRLSYELTGDWAAATDLAQTALARVQLAWWRVSRTSDPDAYLRRILTKAGTRADPRPGGTPGGAESPPPVRLDQIRRRVRTIRLRRARIIAVPVLADLVAVAAWLVPDAPPAAPPVAPAPQALITNSTAGLGSGVFARGTADGQQWQLTVQDIADPGYRCLPGVSINGNDADPLLPDPDPREQSPVGDAAFVAMGPELPGVGFAFIQVPSAADRIWLDPVGGFRFGAAPVTVAACGEQFRLVGFAYPLAVGLRIHARSGDHAGVSYTVPAALSAPRASPGGPQVDGVWRNVNPAARLAVASGIIASGRAPGLRWSIRVAFGTAGDCFSLSASPVGAGAGSRPEWTAACGPVNTPQGASTIMVLPLGFPTPGGRGVGYAVSVGSSTARLIAELPDGSDVSARPLIVGGRKYAAFFLPGPRRMFWLDWVDAAGRPVAGTTGLPQSGFVQFLPSGVPAMKTEWWSDG